MARPREFGMRTLSRGHLPLIVCCVVLSLLIVGCKREEPPPATQPATQPTTAPATKPATTQYSDIIHVNYPRLPATQPLGVPVDLDYAGHYILPNPICLCPRGDLWIAEPEALPIAEVLKTAVDDQIHVSRNRVVYVQWAVNEDGKSLPRCVIDHGDTTPSEWIDPDQLKEQPAPPRRLLTAGRHYRWNETLPFGDKLIVPSERGISIIGFAPSYVEDYHEILASGDAKDANPPVVLVDGRGILAWSPWDGNHPGGRGAQRYLDGKWIDLSAGDSKWPAKIMHLVPLLDGSVLQLFFGDGDKLQLNLMPLDVQKLDEAEFTKLVEQLSDDDAAKRDAAEMQLTRYGPSSWPLLEKLREDQPPEGKARIDQLLGERVQPSLGGKTLVDGIARITDRFDDGGVLLYAQAGVTFPSEQQDKPNQVVRPAWISIRPGRAVELLEPVLCKDASPAKQHFFAFEEEWLVSDIVQGPRRLAGNHLEPMLTKSEASWARVIGADRRGRWLFKQYSGVAASAAMSPATTRSTQPSTTQAVLASSPLQPSDATLVLDPTMPDPTPKLPVWLMFVDKGKVGWTEDNWPVIKRGGAWSLKERGWQPLDEPREKMITEVSPDAPRQRAAAQAAAELVHRPIDLNRRPSSTRSTTAAAATMPATTMVATTLPARSSPSTTTVASTEPASTQPEPQPILVDSEGRKYYDGKKTLRVVDRDGKETVWTLPGTAASDSLFKVVLIRTEDGRLFLFNERGRVVRIKPTPDGAEPFIVEAVFTHRIPNSDIVRIWLDPAGRIAIAYEGNRLAILFPGGRIPRHIALLIPANEMDQNP